MQPMEDERTANGDASRVATTHWRQMFVRRPGESIALAYLRMAQFVFS